MSNKSNTPPTIGPVATWSWWWVTAPLWIGIPVVLVICVLWLFVAVAREIIGSKR